MKNLRRTIVYEIMGDSLAQKAVAFALLLKHLSNNSSVFHQFTINKLHNQTRVSATAIRKYIAKLDAMGLIKVTETKNGRRLYIKRMVSSARHRNIDLSNFDFNSCKEIYNQLQCLILLVAQSQKCYAERILQQANDPRTLAELKRAKAVSKKYNWRGKFVDNGLSYKRIAKLLGCCIKSAFDVVRSAIARHWVDKKRNFARIPMKDICFREVDGITFTTRDFGYIVSANNYFIASCWKSLITHGIY